MPPRGDSTRAQITDTAMKMFVEQGYDKTSLREIAEACGVTKAALYYHFKAKDDIARSAFAEFGSAAEDILEWFRQAQPGAARTEELVDRLLDFLDGGGVHAMRFFQANPTVLGREDFTANNVGYLQKFVYAAAGRDPDADAMLRATMSMGALLLSATEETPLGRIGDAQSRRSAARALALETLAPLSDRPPPGL